MSKKEKLNMFGITTRKEFKQQRYKQYKIYIGETILKACLGLHLKNRAFKSKSIFWQKLKNEAFVKCVFGHF